MKRAFTLIELLVVIAIIAILAAILFPVFATAREKARQITCASNLKQLGIGFMQYYQDYDEFPPCGNDNHGDGWASQIYPYVKSAGVYHCPDDASRDGAHVSYAYNPNFTPLQTGSDTVWPISKFTATSRTIYLTEVDTYPNVYLCGDLPIPGTSATETGSPIANGLIAWSGFGYTYNLNGACPHYATGPLDGESETFYENNSGNKPHHNDGANYAFADGHVKYLLGSKVSVGNNANEPTDQDTTDSSYDGGNAAGTQYSGSGLRTGGQYSATYSIN